MASILVHFVAQFYVLLKTEKPRRVNSRYRLLCLLCESV